MVIADFLSWWYRNGWRGVLTSNRRRLNSLAASFSVGLLVRTLFSPWRRIMTVPGKDIATQLHALGDNVVSRAIGFVVRIFVLLAAAVLFGLLLVGTALELVAWPLLPVASVVLVVWGIA